MSNKVILVIHGRYKSIEVREEITFFSGIRYYLCDFDTGKSLSSYFGSREAAVRAAQDKSGARRA